MKDLTPDQLTAFFQKAGKSGVYERCYMDLDNRPAAGELLGLKWTGIDFQRKTLRIQRRIARQNGGNVKTVSGMMGHYSAGFTLDTYAHVTKDTQIQAVNTVSGILTAARN